MSAAGEPQWEGAWSAALDELELDVRRVEQLLLAPPSSETALVPATSDWRPPVGLGPLPDVMRDRAVALHTRQLAAAEALVRSILGNRRHASLLERIENGSDGDVVPAYVDRSA